LLCTEFKDSNLQQVRVASRHPALSNAIIVTFLRQSAILFSI
jgi:hypothetical protein